MAAVVACFEKDKVAGADLAFRNLLPIMGQLSGGPGQGYMEKIFVGSLYKGRAVDPVGTEAAEFVGGQMPFVVVGVELVEIAVDDLRAARCGGRSCRTG